MPIIERPNGHDAVEERGELVGAGEAINKRRVERTEFMLQVNESLHVLRLMAANHNHTVAILDALVAQAHSLESIPGVKVNYFYNPKIIDFAVEAEEKHYGLIPVELSEDEEVAVGGEVELNGEIEGGAEDEELEAMSADYGPIDKVDFYILTEKLRNNLAQVALQLTEQIQSLKILVQEIEDYEDESGILLDFFLDDDNSLFSYAIRKKPPVGFAGMLDILPEIS